MLVQGAGKKGFSNLSFYCASKLGVFGLSESIIDEINPHLYYTAWIMTIYLDEIDNEMIK